MSLDGFLNRDKKHGTPSHRRAPKMEKALAQRSGGSVVRGSGAGNEKSDVKDAWEVLRIECKTTKHKSFSVTRDMVEKIESEAISTSHIPAIVVEFISENGVPQAEVAVVPTWALPHIADFNKD